MWTLLRDVLVGVEKDPKVVAAARALILYLLPIGVEAGAAYLAGWGVASPEFAGMAAGTTILMRAVGEAVIDQLKAQKLGIGNSPDQKPEGQ